MPIERKVIGAICAVALIWKFTTVVPVLHLLAGAAHVVMLVLLGMVIVPAGTALFLFCLLALRPARR